MKNLFLSLGIFLFVLWSFSTELSAQGFACQTIDIEVDYNTVTGSNPLDLSQNEILNTCEGFTLTTTVDFPQNNVNYSQTLANSTFTWTLKNPSGVHHNQVLNGISPTFELTDFVLYRVELDFTDINGCKENFHFYIVNTSPNTEINLSLDEDTICLDEQTIVRAAAIAGDVPPFMDYSSDPRIIDFDSTGNNPGFLSSSINVTGYPAGAQLTSNCVERVCMTMEHSNVNELTIYMTVPSGDTIMLIPDLGNGSNGMGDTLLMGIPNINDEALGTLNANNPIGTPFRYCFSPDATNHMHNLAGGMTAGSTFAESVEGTPNQNFYADNPVNGNSFDNIGGFLNGAYTLFITDSTVLNNGYFFGWDFELCATAPVEYVFTAWASDPNGTFVSSQDADSTIRLIKGIANTANNGITEITYEVVDNYGCNWEESIDLKVWDLPQAGDTDTVFCEDTYNINVTIPQGMPSGSWTTTTPPGAIGDVVFSPNNSATNPTVTVPALGTYDFIYTSICGTVSSQTITFDSEEPILEVANDTVITCNLTVPLKELKNKRAGKWTVSAPNGETVNIANPNIFSTTATVSDYGKYIFTFTYDWCDASSSFEAIFEEADPIIVKERDTAYCSKTIGLSATVEGAPGNWSGKGPGNRTFTDITALNTDVTVDEYGDYTFYYTGCNRKDSIMVHFTTVAPNIQAPKFVNCGKEAYMTSVYYSYADSISLPATWSITKTPPGTSANLIQQGKNAQVLQVSDYGVYGVEIVSCDSVHETEIAFFCDLEIPNVFSPDNDGVNELFIIRNLNKDIYTQSDFNVWNRWGNTVYHHGAYGLIGDFWDGKDNNGEPLRTGVYFYELVTLNKYSGEEISFKGTINIFTDGEHKQQF
ncbi:MAG: gliding motility-associated C-terminal domain-containing protein [Flavobacteriales bacterium]|jgi:gliding motility-associated-like protein|nr:gliding motility-associated C-terminal domain-containing protein [Flavobacteriales bacterium]